MDPAVQTPSNDFFANKQGSSFKLWLLQHLLPKEHTETYYYLLVHWEIDHESDFGYLDTQQAQHIVVLFESTTELMKYIVPIAQLLMIRRVLYFLRKEAAKGYRVTCEFAKWKFQEQLESERIKRIIEHLKCLALDPDNPMLDEVTLGVPEQ